MQTIVIWGLIAIFYLALAALFLLLRRSQRKWLELKTDYERLLKNHESMMPIQQAIEAAMMAQQPGESGCLTITVQRIDPSEAPSIGLPPGSRLH